MNEQMIPSSYSGGGGNRTLVNNPYGFNIDDGYEVYGELYIKINMVNYAIRMIPNYRNITEIPDGHLPKDLDRHGYESNWSNAFARCGSLKYLPDPFYNWNGATDISNAFYSCYNLTGNIPNIPNSVVNMSGAFYFCENLTGSIPNIPNNVTNMYGAFEYCISLTGNIPNIPNSVTDMSDAFSICSNLTGSIPNIPNSVTNMSHAFHSCTNLTGSIPNIPNSVTNMVSAFAFCSNLTGGIPNIPDSVTNISGSFTNCYNLKNSNVYIYSDNLNDYRIYRCFDNIPATINIYCHANTNTYNAFVNYVNASNNTGSNGPRYLYTF